MDQPVTRILLAMAARRRREAITWFNDVEHVDDITNNHIKLTYRVNVPQCKGCKRNCKGNPNCLLHCGQNIWLNGVGLAKLKSDAKVAFDKAFNFDAMLCLRKPWPEWVIADEQDSMTNSNNRKNTNNGKEFVGLINMGATCYANVLLQTWFHNPEFRLAIYHGAVLARPGTVLYNLALTFTYMQLSLSAHFCPSELLVSTMQLRPQEQQDAQEFAQLFVVLLKSEMSIPTQPSRVRNAMSCIFQGKRRYVTTCLTCESKSSIEEVYMHLDATLTPEHSNEHLDSDVDDNCESINECPDLMRRLKHMLRIETMKGDEQYYCAPCNSKQDALRQMELLSAPAVLQINLLRFVYDRSTLTKRKSRKTIQFPVEFNFAQFISGTESLSPAVYSLSAVILHRGPTAYHGHYLAHVRVADGRWIEFDDGNVQELKRAKKSPAAPNGIVVGLGKVDEIHSVADPNEKKRKSKEGRKEASVFSLSSGYYSSHDACMLFYTLLRPQSDIIAASLAADEAVPAFCKDKVIVDNIDLERRTRHFVARRLVALGTIDDRIKWVRSFIDAPLAPVILDDSEDTNAHNSDGVLMPTSDVEWVPEELLRDAFSTAESEAWPSPTETRKENSNDDLCMEGEDIKTANSSNEVTVLLENGEVFAKSDNNVIGTRMDKISKWYTELRCPHGLLHPLKVDRAKRISTVAADMLLNQHGGNHFTKIDSRNITSTLPRFREPHCFCKTCVVALYDRHFISKAITPSNDIVGMLVSKNAFDNWRSFSRLEDNELCCDKDEMLISHEQRFNASLLCSHGSLSPTATYKVVTEEVWTRLYYYFPDAVTIKRGTPLCETCVTASTSAELDLKAMKVRVSEERHKLSFLVRLFKEYRAKNNVVPCRSSTTTFTPDHRLISADFLKSWTEFIKFEGDRPSNELIYTALMCEHGLLCIDMTEDHPPAVLISSEQWKTLVDIYPNTPIITSTTIVCNECACAKADERRRLRGKYQEAPIWILKKPYQNGNNMKTLEKSSSSDKRITTNNDEIRDVPHRDDEIACVDDHSIEQQQADVKRRRIASQEPVDQEETQLRRSSRTRKGKKIVVSSSQTLMQLKIVIMQQFEVATFDQHLSISGRPLEDNNATLEELGVPPQSTLDLTTDTADDMNAEEALLRASAAEARSQQELGFAGTGLFGHNIK